MRLFHIIVTFILIDAAASFKNVYTFSLLRIKENKRHPIQNPIYEIKRPTHNIPNLWHCLTYANNYQRVIKYTAESYRVSFPQNEIIYKREEKKNT